MPQHREFREIAWWRRGPCSTWWSACAMPNRGPLRVSRAKRKFTTMSSIWQTFVDSEPHVAHSKLRQLEHTTC